MAASKSQASLFVARRCLFGWKEIAVHLNCSVRTVQRRKQSLGLPVYQSSTSERAGVYAFTDELEAWVYVLPARRSELFRLREEVARLRLQNSVLRARIASRDSGKGAPATFG